MITFNKNDYDKILEYAKVNLPEEACGLIGGTIEDGAYDSKSSYMILSLMNADEPVLNSFHIEGNVSEKEDLHII